MNEPDHARFPSVRAALAHMFSRRRGSGYRSPSLRPVVQGSRPTYDEHAAHLMGALIIGQLKIPPDSEDWERLRAMVEEKAPVTDRTRSLYMQVLRAMRREDLLVKPRGTTVKRTFKFKDSEDVVWTAYTFDSDRLAASDSKTETNATKNDLTACEESAQE